MHRLPLVATAVAAALALTPPAASANISCEFGGTVLNVRLSGGELVRASLTVAPDGAVVVTDDDAYPRPCTGATPTVSNTAAVSVVNQPGMLATQVTIKRAGRFGPGPSAADESGGSPEIEFFVDLKDDPESSVIVETDEAGGSVRIGDLGINPNATDFEVRPDVDITVVSDSFVAVVGGPEMDRLGAQGGRGTGNPLTSRVSLFGGAGPDELVGGEGRDWLQGEAGDDRLFGLGDNDTLDPGTGDDSLDGGPGSDWVLHQSSPAGVTVDLAVLGPQLEGDLISNVENVAGTAFADVLRGDDGPNILSGSGGNDVLEGRAGADRLFGSGGDDALDIRDGGADRADCGTETDSVTADPPGTDTLIACETAAFPVPAGGGQAPPDTVAPSFLGRVRAVRRRPTTLRYALSEAATVTFSVLRRRRGRFRRVGTFRAEAVAGANARRLRLRRRGAYRVLLVAVDPAGNESRPTSVRFSVPKRRKHA